MRPGQRWLRRWAWWVRRPWFDQKKSPAVQGFFMFLSIWIYLGYNFMTSNSKSHEDDQYFPRPTALQVLPLREMPEAAVLISEIYYDHL